MTSVSSVSREVFIGARIGSGRRLIPESSRNMTIRELAASSGLPVNRIRNFEHAKRAPTPDELIAIAKALRRDVLWFVPPEERELTADDMKDSRCW